MDSTNKIFQNPIYSNEKSKIYTFDREGYPKVFRRLDKNDFSKEEWEELCSEQFIENPFPEEDKMDPINWCNACKLGVCEIRGHD
jgi:hypothetical protein